MYVLFYVVFEKVKKKCIFGLNFLKTGPMDLKICAKKTCNRVWISTKDFIKVESFLTNIRYFKSGSFFFDLTVFTNRPISPPPLKSRCHLHPPFGIKFLIGYLLSKAVHFDSGGGTTSERLIMDPTTGHRMEKVKSFLKRFGRVLL